MSLVRPLDRYVFTEWLKIFCATAVGLPLLLVVIDLTDHLQRYLDRNLPRGGHRAELRVLDAAVAVHGDAGGGAVRDGVLASDVHAPLRDHGGEGVGDQLLPDASRRSCWARCSRRCSTSCVAEIVPITDARRQRPAAGVEGRRRHPAVQLRVRR